MTSALEAPSVQTDGGARRAPGSNSRLNRMDRTRIDGVELEYELRGAGEPIVLIHWGVGVVWAEPLLDEPALADGYRLLSYHRAGFAGSGRIEGSISMADHAVKASGARMEELQDLCSYVQDTSPVKDVLGNPVPVTTTIEVIGR